MTDNSERWGIVYVPKAGVSNAQKRWNQIRSYLEFRGVKYDFVQSNGEGSVERITRLLIDSGHTTIVVIGGDEALNDAINAIMFTPREVRQNLYLGLVPNGIGNDFADFWGLDTDDYKKAIHRIIEHNSRPIDVGYCSYQENGEQKVRYFLMAVNIGLGAQAIRLSDICRRWGKINPSYLWALFSLFRERKEYKMRFRVNSEDVSERIMTLCIGNSRGYGLTPSAVPYNGWLDVSQVCRPKGWQTIRGLYLLLHNQFLNYEQVKPYRTKQIEILQSEGTMTCLDGRTLVHTFPLTISLEPSAVNFIINS
ncbi:MAG: lipid kinase [Bacteroidaceae bacterium]|nr:lipid kinase [Bacteroidaceae bacterium]